MSVQARSGWPMIFVGLLLLGGPPPAASWRNVRFYYNPITAKLEPIAYDAELRAIHHHSPEPMHGLMLADPVIREEYQAALKVLAQDSNVGIPGDELADLQERLLPALHRRFPLLTPFDVSGLSDSAAAVLNVDPIQRIRVPANKDPETPGELPRLGPERFRPQDLILASRVTDPQGDSVLELSNLMTFPVNVRFAGATELERGGGLEEIVLPRTESGARPSTVTLPSETSALPDSLFVHASDGQPGAWVKPVPYYPVRTNRPIPAPSLADAVASEAFHYDAMSRMVISRPGQWNLDGVVSLPDGVGLLAPGTELRMGKGGAIIVRGPTVFHGRQDAPIVLSARNPAEPWRGIVVLNTDASAYWSHVRVSGTSGLAFPDWSLTGSTVLHGGEVAMSNVSFTDTSAEDALNLVNTRFELSHVVVERAASDGVDIDFGEGSIVGGALSDIGFAGGGDALDFSGSRVKIVGTHFARVGDKAISVGEGSQVWVEDAVMEDAGVGVVSKDGSYLSLMGSTLRRSKYYDLMTYIKKPEYGGTVFIARNVDAGPDGPIVKVQTGTAMDLDGISQLSEDFNVDALYEAIMSKVP